MTKKKFFEVWDSFCGAYNLDIADGLVEAIGSNELMTQDELDDKELLRKIDDALGRWIVANDDLLRIFVDLEDEFGE